MSRFARVFELPRTYALLVCAALLLAGCRPAHAGKIVPSAASPRPAEFPEANAADVRFMSGMIPHHAQAILIAGWAPSHDAGAEIRRLAERIIVAQRDEIALASGWLRAHGLDAPAADAATAGPHAGHGHLMPGMLTAEELKRLDDARGDAFDELFLEYMIRHHEGALVMVDQLFASPGAAQDDDVFRFASDVFADQTAEIDRMQKMLDARAGRP